uniref:(California timema) hypothetical protein n=1 Tax=Timema californicum TaxID=61474 RepID=A0A7R9PBD0_TIMCA|nr:unnamed protein product [Timema californicum]
MKTQLHKEKLASMVKSQDMKALVSSGFSQRMKGFLKPTGYKPMLAAVFSWSSHTDDCCQPTERVPDGPEARSLEPYYTLVSKCGDPLSIGVNSTVNSFFHHGSTQLELRLPTVHRRSNIVKIEIMGRVLLPGTNFGYEYRHRCNACQRGRISLEEDDKTTISNSRSYFCDVEVRPTPHTS